MNPDQALQVYLKQIDRFCSTQTLQWKVNFAAWGLLVVAIHFLGKEEVEFPPCPLWILASVFLFVHTFTIIKIQHSLEATKRIHGHILDSLSESADNTRNIVVDVEKLTKKNSFGRNGLLWVIFQFVITTMLIVILLTVYYTNV